VEVRVLFGALRRSPAPRGFFALEASSSAPAGNFRGNALWQWGTPPVPHLVPPEVRMSVHHDAGRQRWVVRRRGEGRQRIRRFRTPEEAGSFDEAIRSGKDAESAPSEAASPPLTASEGPDGVHPYTTRSGVRWRFVFRQSDGTMSGRRAFASHRAAARARERLTSLPRGGSAFCRSSGRGTLPPLTRIWFGRSRPHWRGIGRRRTQPHPRQRRTDDASARVRRRPTAQAPSRDPSPLLGGRVSSLKPCEAAWQSPCPPTVRQGGQPAAGTP
jgi:hypothetical protein